MQSLIANKFDRLFISLVVSTKNVIMHAKFVLLGIKSADEKRRKLALECQVGRAVHVIDVSGTFMKKVWHS